MEIGRNRLANTGQSLIATFISPFLFGIFMAWEVWSDKGGYDSTYGHMGFFCNTADVSFGPVFLTDTNFDKGIFYDMWEKANFADPRLDEGGLWSKTHRIIHLMDYKDNVDAMITVYRGEPTKNNIVFQMRRKANWDNMDFSPFHPPLEALSEDDFDTVNILIEDANNDMKVLTISEYTENKGSTKLSDNGITVEINWEVINE